MFHKCQYLFSVISSIRTRNLPVHDCHIWLAFCKRTIRLLSFTHYWIKPWISHSLLLIFNALWPTYKKSITVYPSCDRIYSHNKSLILRDKWKQIHDKMAVMHSKPHESSIHAWPTQMILIVGHYCWSLRQNDKVLSVQIFCALGSQYSCLLYFH